jgi:peptidoglycan/xylan/chitin deacetylase (PgdA/CDA1 family)
MLLTLSELGIAAGVSTAAAATLINGALRPGSQLFGRTLIAGNNPNEFALTYDDGPNGRSTEPLLDVLARHNARATFFMIGRFVRQRPDIARQVHAAGHLIGNHTDTHPWLAWQSAARIREELLACNQALEDALGVPIHYFRPPHGARRPYVLRQAAELGLTTVQWNAMGMDWQPLPADRIAANVNRGIARARKQGLGSNILLHDGFDQSMGADRSQTVRATEILLQRFHQNNSRVVTVDAWH